MFGIVNQFLSSNLYIIPYGEFTLHYSDSIKEGEAIGIFIQEEFNDEKSETLEQ